MGIHRLDLADARRIAVRAQLLDAPRPTDLLAVVRQLTLLQIDPTAAVAPCADLVAWSRLGSLTPVVPLAEARRIRDERRLRSLGIAREKGTAVPVEPVVVGDAGEPATVEGVPGTWRMDPEAPEGPSKGARRCCRRSTA